MNLSCSTGAIGKTCWNVTYPLKRETKQVQLSLVSLHALSLIIEYLHKKSLS